jgi:mannose/fructose/N-acetylgalactosamine-specific phosphotransferase system component IIC
MLEDFVIVALIGGLVAIDTTAAFQTMVSQPLSVGALVGLVFGDLRTGLLVGTSLQLIWIGAMPVGGSRIPDAGPAAAAAAAIAIFLQRRYHVPFNDACFITILFAFPVAMVGLILTVFLRRINHALARLGDTGMPHDLSLAVILGIGVSFIGGVLLTGAATFVGIGLSNLPYSMIDSQAGLIATFGLGIASTMNILVSKSMLLPLLLGVTVGVAFHILL